MSTLQTLVNQPYRHGFVTDIESDVAPKGLSEDTIRMISAKKSEPQWLLDFRLEAYRHWLTMDEPKWPNVKYPKIDFQQITYYSAPKPKKLDSIDQVDPTDEHAQFCLREYFTELDRRFDTGFDPDASLPADPAEMRAPPHWAPASPLPSHSAPPRRVMPRRAGSW